ncbi:MAG: heparan-alpha-glucosaminide N-acetyltransferase domain-containing protein [Anaerolineales bacterium]
MPWTSQRLNFDRSTLNNDRFFSADALRGLIVALMALDHANLFIAHQHSSGEYWGGLFPTYSDPVEFLVRFVTHFCAPGFFFLTGMGMILFARSRHEQGWSKTAIVRHFWVRGLTLIALQFLIVNRAWELSPVGWSIRIYVGVLSALGLGMILCSLLLWIRSGFLIGLALILLFGTELMVPNPNAWGSGFGWITHLFVLPGGIADPAGGFLLWSNYPVLPWMALVVFGLLFGRWLAEDPHTAYRRAWKLGLTFLITFLVVRTIDSFGNIRPRLSDGWMDFLNPVKYPPSITFTLMTSGVNLLLVWLFSRLLPFKDTLLRPLVVFGQAPLFFYVSHLFLYATLGARIAPQGASLPAMLPVWLLGLVILYPMCRGYRRLKRHQFTRPVLQFL